MKHILVLLLAVALGFGFTRVSAGAPAQRPGQPHSDFFSCGVATCDNYNPITQQIRMGQTVSWKYVVQSGCYTNGSTERAVRAAMSSEAAKVKVNAIEAVGKADMVITGNCGVSFANICGGPPVVGCLGRGYPYDNDIDIDVSQMDTWAFDVSRLAVVTHEAIGHAWASRNEQYCLGTEAPPNPCDGQVRFSPAPDWQDIMNTGPDSRHVLGPIELEWWSRMMYDVITPAPDYQDCTTYSGWAPTVSCWWPKYDAWLWTVPTSANRDELWQWSPANPQWVCTNECPR